MNVDNYKKYVWVAGTVALVSLSFTALANGFGELKALKHPSTQAATISVSGEGEVTALPDIATVVMTVRESAKTVPEAQALAEKKVTAVLDSLAKLNVNKKDTKTLSYTINPKYENVPVYCNGYCTESSFTTNTKVVGYEISQTLQIKVRTIDSAGAVIAALGEASVTEVSGPEFTVDDMDTAQAEARAKAIADAKTKAKKIAKDLGVSLGEITQFNENNGGYIPMMVRAESYGGAKAMDSVSLPQGESVITSYVSITYSLR